MGELTLYAESTWMSPWVFHVMVALEEKQLPYKLVTVNLPFVGAERVEVQKQALIAKTPILIHGDFWLTESVAISEYLAETFPTPGHPRLFPADLGKRARARQIMSMVRTSMHPLREERPTSSVFGRPVTTPLSDKARADADELVRIANAVVTARSGMFGDWCIADADLSLALMRLVANQDPVPDRLVEYAIAQFDRRSIKKYLAHLPTTP